jgi:hypothetical protein
VVPKKPNTHIESTICCGQKVEMVMVHSADMCISNVNPTRSTHRAPLTVRLSLPAESPPPPPNKAELGNTQAHRLAREVPNYPAMSVPAQTP